jgi:transcription-repair coupling factor (superfamily II helicase)
MRRLYNLLLELDYFEKIFGKYDAGSICRIDNLEGASPALVAWYLARRFGRPVVYISAENSKIEEFYENSRNLAGEKNTAYIPEILELPYERRKSNPGKISARLEGLEKISRDSVRIAAVSAPALLEHFPEIDTLKNSRLDFKPGDSFEFSLLPEFLDDFGYERVEIVDQMGEYAVRGGIVDLFPWSSARPYRIEFWGDEIESIREFDILSQRSIKKSESLAITGMEKYGGEKEMFFDLLPDAIIWTDELHIIENKFIEKWKRIEERYLHALKQDEENSPPETLFFEPEKILNILREKTLIYSGLVMKIKSDEYDFGAKSPVAFTGNVQKFPAFLAGIQKKWDKIYIYADHKAQAERLKELIFDDEENALGKIGIRHGAVTGGFSISSLGLLVMTHHQLFRQYRRRRIIRKVNSASYLRALRSLNYGDYVVHVDYGIGIFRGLEKIKVGGIVREVVRLEYDEGESLYVHLDKINKIQKYSSQEGAKPSVHKLGGKLWDRDKQRTRKAIEKIAGELVEIYAERANSKGFAYTPDTKWQAELEASFPYEDTPDQENATRRVKEDMEKDMPMDRLICGDVGFGKTEIAVRAAFKAVQDSKQVAVLVPTTLLASQHYDTFSERMRDFPVTIAALSRFQTPRRQKEVVNGLKEGSIDIVIGTHRLLSSDVQFKDLGLMIIDEEQRFGVKHKEKLKKLRANVDVLSMTATPIPRTLHMSLIGVRGLSNIETPPKNRLPVITEVIQWEDEAIYQAVMNEVGRGGQVFFVHNRVETIEAVKVMLEKIVPSVKIGVAHGQMPERKLEKVMVDFKKRKYDLLLASMIIENGLDIPSTNTIIINRADRFGLSQLYQLRGRVGRAEEQAYCYLITPHPSRLTDIAIKRLNVIREFTELGSGFKLALRDLELRGAGNLLGHQQSGFINTVGFDMYVKILNEAIEDLKAGIDAGEKKKKVRVETTVDFDTNLFFPQKYITNSNERLAYYHRLLAAETEEQVDDIKMEIEDRFGKIPDEADALFISNKIRLLAAKYLISRIHMRKNNLKIFFAWKDLATEEFPKINFREIMESPRLMNVEFEQGDNFVLKATIKGLKIADRLRGLKEVLLTL